jgi:NAD(P)-dependent dehydrogenase (short-subunit alcohol dehydrogenase family)
VTYLKVDIRDYQSLLSLFDAAHHKNGEIDMAICCAAVTERTGYWEPDKLNLDSVREVRTVWIWLPEPRLGLSDGIEYQF